LNIGQRIFKFIIEYRKSHNGDSPTLREICVGANVSSTSVVAYYLDRFEYYGLVKLNGQLKMRNIHIPNSAWYFEGDLDEVLELLGERDSVMD